MDDSENEVSLPYVLSRAMLKNVKICRGQWVGVERKVSLKNP